MANPNPKAYAAQALARQIWALVLSANTEVAQLRDECRPRDARLREEALKDEILQACETSLGAHQDLIGALRKELGEVLEVIGKV